jgi:hypothetical protein
MSGAVEDKRKLLETMQKLKTYQWRGKSFNDAQNQLLEDGDDIRQYLTTGDVAQELEDNMRDTEEAVNSGYRPGDEVSLQRCESYQQTEDYDQDGRFQQPWYSGTQQGGSSRLRVTKPHPPNACFPTCTWICTSSNWDPEHECLYSYNCEKICTVTNKQVRNVTRY